MSRLEEKQLTSAQSSTAYPPPPPETPAERKGRLAALFVMPFLIVTMMYATYMGTMHDPTTRDLPVAVIGQGAEVEALADELDSEALDVRVVADTGAAHDLMQSQEIVGALAPARAGSPATVYSQMAGGASTATQVKTLLGAAAMGGGAQVENVDLAPLPEGDGTGTMVMFAAMGMMLAGYVPLSGMLMGTPNLLRLRRFVPITLGWAAITSSLIWLVLGPVVGAVDGHYPLFLGVGMLTVTAVAGAMVLFTKLIGPFAVLLGMLLLVVLGVPASNLGVSLHSMPAFFDVLHAVLPLPAAGEALRSAIYFDGQGLGGHLLVLAAWLVAGFGLAHLKERRSGEVIFSAPKYQAPDAPLPALSGGPVATYRMRLFAVAAFPLTIMATVVTLMGFSMHKAELHHMPVAVVAPAAQAQEVVSGLQTQLGDYVELSVVPDVEEAREAILDQELVAAFVLPSADAPAATLLSAGGLGVAQQSAATQMFTPIAAGMTVPLESEDLAPLTEDDSGGSNSLYVGMAWIMAGFLFFAVLRGGAPDITRTRKLMPLVAGWSVGISIWLWFLFDVLIGAVNGHALALIGYGALTVFCVAWASAVLIRMFGMGTLVPVMIVVMLAGVPASGGGLSLYMVPEFFQPLAEVLPLPAAVDIARSVVYLDGSGVGSNLVALAVWGAVGLLLNFVVVDRWTTRRSARPHAPMGPRYTPDRAPRNRPGGDIDGDVDGPSGTGEGPGGQRVPSLA